MSGMWRSLILVAGLLVGAGPVQANSTDSDPELRAELKAAARSAGSFTDRFEAEVWLVDMSQRIQDWVGDTGERMRILKLVHREATRAGLEPELVLSVIHVESLFNRFAISSAGAQGLMQVMPFWKREIGRQGDNLTRIETNLRYGTTILKHYLEREDGDLIRALARYNGSLGQTWYPERVMKAWDAHYFVDH
ncbi:transglycosylase-like protein with SLT domain [Tamilnaduibacter salinus]|uniref:Transglycosylase-like protein with SLT domain n=1 Tax=Tamilnaduibacter salinus TaxID=1484056 RepID=A0A2U1D027_9GAMM|nr:lytic transglycosylase domain-containing protein [Tamilnaduibacter salinus]PVY78377.1 transglycosylase-like protein with SLT domain [Tamilnaduibacter salinus]